MHGILLSCSTFPASVRPPASFLRSSLENVIEALGFYFTRFRRFRRFRRAAASKFVLPWLILGMGAVTGAVTKDGFRQPGDELSKRRRGTRNERVSRRYLRDSVESIPASIVPGFCDYSPGMSVFSKRGTPSVSRIGEDTLFKSSNRRYF